MAEALADVGMISREQAHSVLGDFAHVADEELQPRSHIPAAFESFGVAVRVHTDDVDYADQHYGWLLGEAASLTGGAVTVSNYRFEKDDAADEDEDDEDGGSGAYEDGDLEDGESGAYEDGELEDGDYEEEDGRGVFHFERNGALLSFLVEQESNDYLDVGAARAAIEALSPDDGRDFRCVDNGPGNPPGTTDFVLVLATAEQRAALEHRLGIGFCSPLS